MATPKTNKKKSAAKITPTKAKRSSKEPRQSRRDRKKQHKAEIRAKHVKVSGAFRILRDSLSLVREHWKLFGGITLIYLIATLVLVGSLSSGSNVADLKEAFSAELGQAAASLVLFGFLVGSAGTTQTEVGAAYQSMLLVLISLATIWALRQLLGGKKVTTRDAFYKGMYPLIPFLLVIVLLSLTLLPALVAAFIYNIVIVSGLASSGLEQAFWWVVVGLLIAWTLRLLVNYLFGLYIVTLPDVRPMTAIHAAKKVTMYRRLLVLRKLLFLPLLYLLVGVVVLLPLIMWWPGAAQWALLLLSMFALVFAHVYIYSLYKELI